MARTLAHALDTVCRNNGWFYKILSLYDTPIDVNTKYFSLDKFEGFGKNRTLFFIKTIKTIRGTDTIILSHINLASIGLLIKLLNPKCKIWVIAHGIEVWRKLPLHKRLILKCSSKIICVSRYTRQEMIRRHQLNPSVCHVLNNAIDPFIKVPDELVKPDNLLERYSLTHKNNVILTLTRLTSTEMYKGYDRVIAAISNLKREFPDVKYILAGKYDTAEGERVKKLIAEHHVGEQVILTGFIAEDELADHFLLADLFVLPSKKEGFGIVFIEALACGLPVICGSVDGSVDAIRDGELGKAINPDNGQELEDAIAQSLQHPLTISERKSLQQKCLEYFNEDQYVESLEHLLVT